MQAGRSERIPFEGIGTPEPTSARVQVACAVVVEAEVGVVLFAGEEEIVGCDASRVDEIAEG